MGTTNAVGVDLVSAILRLVDLLNEVDKYPALYANKRVLQNAIRRYEHVWVPLLAGAKSETRATLVPPLDVEWVWMCHMLCPRQYAVDSAALWSAASQNDTQAIVDHELLPPRAREKAVTSTKALWEGQFPSEPFDVTKSLSSAPIQEDALEDGVKSVISYDIAAAAERQMAFHYQVCIMPQYRSRAFLQGAVERYSDMFLKLHAETPRQAWVPTYDIDVAWHAHMMHPLVYAADTQRICGRLLPHDDTMNDRTAGQTLDVRWKATQTRWKELFDVPLSRDGGMWRGNVTLEERALRPSIQLEIDGLRDVGKKSSRSSVKDAYDFLSAGQRAAAREVDWLHSSQAKPREGLDESCGSDGQAPENDDTHVERFSGLVQASGGQIILRSRSVVSRVEGCCDTLSGPARFLEVYAPRKSNAAGSSQNGLPLATAHDLPAQSMDTVSRFPIRKFSCSRDPQEQVLLLRVGGEDFALLRGRWKGAKPAKKGVPGIPVPEGEGLEFPYPTTFGVPGILGTRGHPGLLELSIWFLDPAAPKRWVSIQAGLRGAARASLAAGSSLHCLPPYQLKFPRWTSSSVWSSAGGQRKLEFDVFRGAVNVSRSGMILHGYLIALASSMLFVSLQPRYQPRKSGGGPDETMYPAWTIRQKNRSMLRAAGGEVVKGGRRNGYGQVLFTLRSDIFFASTDGVGDPAGRNLGIDVPGACGGCGGCGGCYSGQADTLDMGGGLLRYRGGKLTF